MEILHKEHHGLEALVRILSVSVALKDTVHQGHMVILLLPPFTDSYQYAQCDTKHCFTFSLPPQCPCILPLCI